MYDEIMPYKEYIALLDTVYNSNEATFEYNYNQCKEIFERIYNEKLELLNEWQKLYLEELIILLKHQLDRQRE